MEGVKVQMGVALLPAMTAGAEAASFLAEGFNEHVMPAIRDVSDFIDVHLGLAHVNIAHFRLVQPPTLCV